MCALDTYLEYTFVLCFVFVSFGFENCTVACCWFSIVCRVCCRIWILVNTSIVVFVKRCTAPRGSRCSCGTSTAPPSGAGVRARTCVCSRMRIVHIRMRARGRRHAFSHARPTRREFAHACSNAHMRIRMHKCVSEYAVCMRSGRWGRCCRPTARSCARRCPRA